MDRNCDFSGWATRNDLKCADGRIIRKDAFKCNNGQKVPLVWNHQHNDPLNVLGHALLENRDEGVYAYCSFNNSESGQAAREVVEHGDICALSIFANQLQQRGPDVLHGVIREVSLVMAGANPGAFIESVIKHGVECEEEGIIYTGEPITLVHAAEAAKEDNNMQNEKKEDNRTVADVFDTLTEDQKTVVYAIIGQVLESNKAGADTKNDSEEEDSKMQHNLFDPETRDTTKTLSHDAVQTIIGDAKRCGSMKASVLEHSAEYGIDQIDYLFPEAKSLNNPPEFIKRDTGWVGKVMAKVHHTPFSRIKSVFANITEDEARAKGYFKGNLKKEEVFSLLKRTTSATTVYKKQKMDRDDKIEITDFDVIAWLKSEMRMMLDEELARAYLIGDGRLASSDDKINESNIRPIYKDDDLYTIKRKVPVAKGADEDTKARSFIKQVIRARKDYKGSGNPDLYTTEDMLTSMLLLTDTTGRDLYTDESQLAKKLRVNEIITVPVMEGVKGVNGGELMGIVCNLSDYNVGADKGGAINMFEDFDIDYNQEKFLIETRCSGALTKPYSAIALELDEAIA